MKQSEALSKVKTIQSILKVEPDGHFGERSKTSLNNAIAANDKTVLSAIQSILKIKTDGVWGLVSSAAMKQVIKRSLEPDVIIEDQQPMILLPSEYGAFDERTKRNLLSLDPKARPRFAAFIAEAQQIAASHGYAYKAISGNRTWKEQNELFQIGRSLPGKRVTNAIGGQSNHNFGIALDFGVFDSSGYLDASTKARQAIAYRIHAEVSTLDQKHGIIWGGNWVKFKDIPHYEIKTNLTLSQRRTLYLQNGSIL